MCTHDSQIYILSLDYSSELQTFISNCHFVISSSTCQEECNLACPNHNSWFVPWTLASPNVTKSVTHKHKILVTSFKAPFPLPSFFVFKCDTTSSALPKYLWTLFISYHLSPPQYKLPSSLTLTILAASSRSWYQLWLFSQSDSFLKVRIWLYWLLLHHYSFHLDHTFRFHSFIQLHSRSWTYSPWPYRVYLVVKN